MAYEVFVTCSQELDENDIMQMSEFLLELAPMYKYEVEFCITERIPLWEINFTEPNPPIATFMRSFYSRKFILKDVPAGCNITIIGQSPQAQMLVQQNMAIMMDSLADNTDASEYIMNDQIKEVVHKLNGIDEFNSRNRLYTFKFVVETLLDKLGEQGLVTKPESIKKTLFPSVATH